MNKGYRLQVLVYSLLFFLLFTVNCTLYPTFAVDSTPSADIKAKLDDLKKEIASKAAKLIQEVDKKLKDKAYIGKVKQKSENSVTLATKNGPKIVNINQDTEFESNVKGSLRKATKKFSQKTLAEEDYVAALGDIDETNVLTAKKIILLPQPETDSESKTYLWGQILSISDKLVTLKDKNQKNVAVSTPHPSEIKLNDFVILTGTTGKNDIFEANFVYVIPQGGFIKPKGKVATASAQKATPSAQVATRSANPKPKQ